MSRLVIIGSVAAASAVLLTGTAAADLSSKPHLAMAGRDEICRNRITFPNRNVSVQIKKLLAIDDPFPLLAGGDKRTQTRDIQNALRMARHILE